MGLGTRIKQIRREMGLTQRKFGNEIGVSNNYISEIEAEKTTPSMSVILSIELVFRINRKWLIHGKGEKYTKGKILFTDKEMELIKSLREMPDETKKIFLALIEKLRKK